MMLCFATKQRSSVHEAVGSLTGLRLQPCGLSYLSAHPELALSGGASPYRGSVLPLGKNINHPVRDQIINIQNNCKILIKLLIV